MKNLVVIFVISISAFNVNSQSLASFCNNEYGGTLLKIANSKIDSLKELGVKNIINLNHYVGHREGGYSKIIWKENDNINGLIIEVDQITNEEFVIRTEGIDKSEILWIVEFLEKNDQTEIKGVKSDCDGWISHQPYYLLYKFENDIEDCISLAQSDTKCNQQNFSVKLINRLKEVSEFYKLMLTENERKN